VTIGRGSFLMETNKGFVDPEIEKKVLINILYSFEDLEYVIDNLSAENFQELIYRRLYDLIYRYYKKYFKILPQKALETQLTKESYTGKERNEVFVAFCDFSSREGDGNTHFYVDTLKDLYVKRSLYQVHLELKNGLEDTTREAGDLLSVITSNVLDVNQTHAPGGVIHTTITGDVDARWAEYEDKERNPDKYKGIPFGFKKIDEVLGGIRPEDVGMLFSRSGVGKTRMLFNIGCNAIENGKTVLFFTIEMSARELQLMWESRAISLSKEGIYNGVVITHSEIEFAKLDAVKKEVYKRFLQDSKMNKLPFLIVDMPRGCTPAQIEAELLKHYRKTGKMPDLVLADYVNLMFPNGKWDKTYEKYELLLKELKQVARTHRVPIVTAMQQTRESVKSRSNGSGSDTPGLEAVALSDRAADHCNWVFNLIRTQKDIDEHQIQVIFVKARNAPTTKCILRATFEYNYIGDFPQVGVPKSTTTGVTDEHKQF